MALSSVTDDFVRDLIERDLRIGDPLFDRFAGHPEDHTGGFVLCDDWSAKLMEPSTAISSVVAHPGHDDAERLRTEGFC